MYYYNLTLKQPTAVTHAIVGEFTGKRGDKRRFRQEIALAKGKVLEILRIDETSGKLISIISSNVFGIIRSIAAFRLTGGHKDYIAIGSDSGRIVIIEYLPEKNKFEKIHQETFGRSGCRRLVPGQHLACDSKGRAVMIGALEKQKLVYQLNRDTQANLTISSPLEAHKANTFVCSIVNVDVGYENPLFACLEIDYEDADQDYTGQAAKNTKQTLTYYELDLGLNHVVRKYSEILDNYANLLIPVPGGDDGPSGLIICFENSIVYKNFGEQKDLFCKIPRRKGETDIPERGIIISCYATHKYTKDDSKLFFFLLQTELGDIFKTDFYMSDDIVYEIKLTYLCSLPVASQICLVSLSHRQIEGGFLFLAAESGNHMLFQIDQLDQSEDGKIFTSTDCVNNIDDDDDELKKYQFKPSEDLKYFNLIDEIYSLAPILTSYSCKSDRDHQIAIASGSFKNSSLRILKHGLKIAEQAVSMLPAVATGIWSLKKKCDSEHDEYIVVSFSNSTLVLGVGEPIEEIKDSGFLSTKRTLACCQIGDDSIIQVHPDGIRRIYLDKRVNEWRTPLRRQIMKCAINQRQVAIALSTNTVLYFELDNSGQLNECDEQKEFNSAITSMSLGEIPPGQTKSQFLAVGFDQKVCIYSLDADDCMTEITRQTFSSTPESITIAELGAREDLSFVTQLYLNVGLQNGELVRTRLDRSTGDLSEPIRRYLGIEPVRLCNVVANKCRAVMANTNRSWLLYYNRSRCNLSPLSYETLDYAASFSSPVINEGIVAISGNSLRILSFEELGDIYNQEVYPLEGTPRKLVVHQSSGNVIVAMSDRLPLLISSTDKSDRWRSVVKLIDPNSGTILSQINFESHQAVLSIALSDFGTASTTLHIGVANDYKMQFKKFSSCDIYTYSLSSDGNELELLHVTPCEFIPFAMSAIRDRLAVGIGRILRIYDLGKKKLLRKCESKRIPNFITTISVCDNRIFVSDVQESFTCMKYRREENVLTVFSDDTYPRWIVSAVALDNNMIVGGDKFGNICILSLPNDVDDDIDDDPGGTRSLWDRGWLGGTTQKLENIATMHLGEIVTSIHKTALTPGRAECIIYTTIMGTVGAMIPFATKDDFEIFQTLEMHMRSEDPPISGRDHLAFCSNFFPLKNIVDGDMCERFLVLDAKTQEKIAEEMDSPTGEITLRIDQMVERII